MELVKEKQPQATIFRFQGRLDSTNAPQIEKQLVEVMIAGEKQLIFDFSKLEYLSSAGIRILVHCHTKIEQAHGHIFLINIPKPIENVLYITGFLPYFRQFETLQEALAAIALTTTKPS